MKQNEPTMSDIESESDFSEQSDISDDSVKPRSRAKGKKNDAKGAKAKGAPKSKGGKKAAAAVTSAASGNGRSAPVTQRAVTDGETRLQEDDITRGPNVTTEAAAKKLILAYLHQQNRPYSAIQVFDNLHKRVPKGTVDKLLPSLSEDADSMVRSKEYGKLRLFWSEKANRTLPSEDQLADLEEQTSALKEEVGRRVEEERALRTELAALEIDPPDSELKTLIESLRRDADGKLRRLGGVSAVPVDPETMRQAAEEHNFLRGSWLKRKVQCLEVVEVLAESMEKKTREVCVLLGVDTDEDAAAVVPDVLRL